ncbi:TauD/TfdA family dioxygenase [Conexibacter sp. SYSU D00693]|uniref:TauD/TfdA dioxygenase family protein n=1 Tax=Conexibacter sp. SYSU D00693 TaxID=2812560 RepID=UPI00196A6FFD|nr:TauD/TfdA family dioxygenase [Conexibacter sp. SYSU D00693]
MTTQDIAVDSKVTVHPVSLALGARLEGVDLTQPIDEPDWAVVRQAFADHSLVIVRGQDITVDDQRRWAQGFSELDLPEGVSPLEMREHTSMFTLEGHPDTLALHNNADRRPGLDHWHTDNIGFVDPPSATVLYAKVTPALGGDTLFASMHLAFEALSRPMQVFLESLDAVHDMRQAFRNPMLEEALRKKGIDPDEHFARHEPAVHPLVRTHPVTGRKALFLSAPHTTGIVGLSDKEARTLLQFLFHHCEDPAFQYRHVWQEGDVLVWDNRALQHLPVADYHPHERLMFRMSVSGDVVRRG